MTLISWVLCAWNAALACGPYEVALYEFGSLYYRNAQGQRVGIDPEVLAEVARRTGCVFHTHVDSRAHIWKALADGHLDMTVSGIATAERLVHSHFIDYINSRNYLIVRKALAPRLDSLQAFTADPMLRLGVVRAFRHGSRLDAWISQLSAAGRVIEFSDAEVLARVFAAGRVDAFLSHPTTWRPLLERNGLLDKVSMLDLAPEDRATGSLVLSRKRVSELDVSLMRSAIAAMRKDGSLEAIMARHVGASVAREVSRQP